MTRSVWQQQLDGARKRNAERDELDRRAGFAAPADCGLVQHLRTACAALEAGVSTQDWDCVFEAMAMLQEHVELVVQALRTDNN